MSKIKKLVEALKKSISEEMDGSELLSKWEAKKKYHHYEGETGLRRLEELIRVIGYRSMDAFFEDNPGAMGAVRDWVEEWVDRLPEWKNNLADAVGGDGEEAGAEEETEAIGSLKEAQMMSIDRKSVV